MNRQTVLVRSLVITAAALFFVGILWIVYLVDTGTHTKSMFHAVFTISDRLTGGDKLGHFLLFGPFTLSINAALNFRRLRSRFYLGSLLVFCFTLADELGQCFIPSRSFELLDILANSAGILLFTWLSLWTERLLRPRPELAAVSARRF
ncbi:MAG: VanZ family protein [Candidatus Electronema sp. V4]|uniref:VanZ family protein n=1 Tax=Candidatus Electronema sp. V4 TaxID=3454756 RepID=UPI004055439D